MEKWKNGNSVTSGRMEKWKIGNIEMHELRTKWKIGKLEKCKWMNLTQNGRTSQDFLILVRWSDGKPNLIAIGKV
jgi:hypothetical protein